MPRCRVFIFIALLCVGLFGCQTDRPTSHAVLHHKWATTVTSASEQRTNEVELRGYDHEGAYLGSHQFIGSDGKHIRVAYFADLDWTGERNIYKASESDTGKFLSWDPHDADLRLNALTLQLDGPTGEWESGPPVRLEVLESYSVGSSVVMVARCVLAEGRDGPLILPLEIELSGNGDAFAHGHGQPPNDLLPERIRYISGNIPLHEYTLKILGNYSDPLTGSPPRHRREWRLTKAGWVSDE